MTYWKAPDVTDPIPSLAPDSEPLAAFVASETVIARSDTPARVKIMEPRTGTVLIINKPGTNEPMVSVNEDGTLTLGEGYTPDAAAREFWDALAQSVGAMWPYLAHAKASEIQEAAQAKDGA